MNQKQAEAMAAIMGGEAWQSGERRLEEMYLRLRAPKSVTMYACPPHPPQRHPELEPRTTPISRRS